MNNSLPKKRTILEIAREIDVFTESDVLVVGGGPGGGHSGYSSRT
jgi:ribulose 1,5-bisphosphate synthetase/thiazole synthase